MRKHLRFQHFKKSILSVVTDFDTALNKRQLAYFLV